MTPQQQTFLIQNSQKMCEQKKDELCARPDFLKNGEINLLASQKFREEKAKCSNAPTKPIHNFIFNAYVSIIAYLKKKSKRTKRWRAYGAHNY